MEHPHKIDLLVAKDLDSCKSRLLRLKEDFDWLAPGIGWGYRVRVRTWQLDTNVVGYSVYKIRRASLDFGSVKVVGLEGWLIGKSENQTQIIGEACLDWFGFLSTFGWVGLVFALIAFGSLLQDSGVAIAMLAYIAVMAGIYGYSHYWINRRKKQLINILTQTFAGDLHGTSTQD